MEKDKRIRKESLLESVIEVSDILKQRRPDLETSLLRTLSEAEAILRKDSLSDDDLAWLKKEILTYLCHFKCLYDFCPLERLDGETDQALWQRWGKIVDRMKERAILLCSDTKKKRK